MYVCICRAVTEQEVKSVIEAGAKTVEAVTAACCAGDDCGACHGAIEEMIEDALGLRQPDGAVHLRRGHGARHARRAARRARRRVRRGRTRRPPGLVPGPKPASKPSSSASWWSTRGPPKSRMTSRRQPCALEQLDERAAVLLVAVALGDDLADEDGVGVERAGARRELLVLDLRAEVVRPRSPCSSRAPCRPRSPCS